MHSNGAFPLQITGYWHTVLLATDDPQTINEYGEMWVHLRHLECSEDCNEIAFGFYIRLKKKCHKFIVVGKRVWDDVYDAVYLGKNAFQIKYYAYIVVILYNENTDQNGKVVRATVLAAKESSVSEEEQKRFEELTVKMNIPKENIRNVMEIGKVTFPFPVV
uniref:lipocalin Cav p 3.0101-like n=1 Tax=Ictidomys tridecemlineatus TaxID=43179 RepID=UPI001A9F253F|nr:lipocalin Cav p 3.0101-like [Ictidomys tridecemlineatus]